MESLVSCCALPLEQSLSKAPIALNKAPSALPYAPQLASPFAFPTLSISLPSPPSSRRDLLASLGLLALPLASPPFALSAPPPCELTIAPSGLGFCDTSPGSGLQASKGMLIKANYVGKLENGQVFDSSYDRGRPLTFRVGVGEVIRGWDQGILGGEGVPPMSEGGKRSLRIPPQLGYGERGAGCRGGSCVIPPNSVLLFDVEFVGKV